MYANEKLEHFDPTDANSASDLAYASLGMISFIHSELKAGNIITDDQTRGVIDDIIGGVSEALRLPFHFEGSNEVVNREKFEELLSE